MSDTYTEAMKIAVILAEKQLATDAKNVNQPPEIASRVRLDYERRAFSEPDDYPALVTFRNYVHLYYGAASHLLEGVEGYKLIRSDC